MINAVLFDLDDTLYSREDAFQCWVRHFVRTLPELTTEAEQNEAATAITAMDAGGYGSKYDTFLKLRAQYPSITGDPQARADQFYDELLAYIGLEPETIECLDALSEHGMPWGIITNGLARQQLKIDRLGLDKRTPCIFISDCFGCHKPDARIFHAAAAKLGVGPHETLFVGDNPRNDIWGARQTGMKTAWLHRGKPWPAEYFDCQPDYTIDRLSDLVKILSLSVCVN